MKRKYEKPAVVFEKDLEALANVCSGWPIVPPDTGTTYNGGGVANYCKTLADCTSTIDS